MSRTVPEWVGATPDTTVPARVKLRVFHRGGKCCAGCGRPLGPADRKICDHKIALINGGENRERNLQTLGATCCNPNKTAEDVAEKSAVYQRAIRHQGFKPKSNWRPMPGTKRSGIRRRMNGRVERWPRAQIAD